jgi:hypothetical protein
MTTTNAIREFPVGTLTEFELARMRAAATSQLPFSGSGQGQFQIVQLRTHVLRLLDEVALYQVKVAQLESERLYPDTGEQRAIADELTKKEETAQDAGTSEI